MFKVAISADGSKLAVDGEESMMYLSGADGSTICVDPRRGKHRRHGHVR